MPRKWRRTGRDALPGCPALLSCRLPCSAALRGCLAQLSCRLPCMAALRGCLAQLSCRLPCFPALLCCPAWLSCSAAGSRSRSSSCPKTPFYQCGLHRSLGLELLSEWHVIRSLGTSTRSAPCAFHFSFSARAYGGRKFCRKGSPPPGRCYLVSQLLVRLHPGSPGLSAPPCRLCTATASSCHAARKVPGNLRAPVAPSGQGWQPFHSGRPRFTPCSRGRCPRRGLESFDYLIAADTKPIFPPLSIVTTFLLRPQLPGAPEPVCFCVFESQPKEERRTAAGCVQINCLARCLCLRSRFCSLP